MKNGTRKDAEGRRYQERNLQLLRGTTVTLLILGIVGSLLIHFGLFDPKPVGDLQVEIQPVAEMTVGDAQQQVDWLDVQLPDGDFSVVETAVYQTGSLDSLSGLAIGTKENHLIIATSPLGYVTIKQLIINNQQSIINQSPIPFQPWPHVKTSTTPNEIWVNVVGSEVTIRINRELLWVGEVEGIGRQVGIVGESFGETAVFDFPKLQLFWQSEK